jgi:hypothetical protein
MAKSITGIQSLRDCFTAADIDPDQFKCVSDCVKSR